MSPYLKIIGIKGRKTEYELLQNELKEKYLSGYHQKLNVAATLSFNPTTNLSATDFQEGHNYIFNGIIESDNCSFRIDVLEKVPLKGKRTKLSYIPILFSANEKISKTDKKLISCGAYLLEVTQGITVKFGKVIYGKNYKHSKIKNRQIYSNTPLSSILCPQYAVLNTLYSIRCTQYADSQPSFYHQITSPKLCII